MSRLPAHLPTLADQGRCAPAKPAKGSSILARRQARAEAIAYEKGQKALVVKRDGAKTCRLVPGCTERERFEGAHVDDKGMGGDHGVRSGAENMLRACFFHHQGSWSLHSGDLRVEFLTPEKCNGPIEVWAKSVETGQEYLLKRETACNVVERD